VPLTENNIMRKNLIILAIVSLTTTAVCAQSIHVGIRAGANMTRIDGMSFSQQFKYGYHLGLAAEVMFSPHVGIEPGLYFNQSNLQTGYSFDTLYKSINPGTIKQVQLNYLTIPLLLDVRPVPFLTVQMGPQFGILMSSHQNLLENGKSAFRNGNLAMVGGLQLNFSKIRIYGRYAVGLNSVNDIDNRDSWHSQTIQMGVGLNL
jgi:Outer membrane protein beta-barrel domain